MESGDLNTYDVAWIGSDEYEVFIQATDTSTYVVNTKNVAAN